MTFKEKYFQAKKNAEYYKSVGDYEKAQWIMEQARGDEISTRISYKYPLSAQISLLMDKDLKYGEWVEYQAYRAQVKNEVDLEIAKFEQD